MKLHISHICDNFIYFFLSPSLEASVHEEPLSLKKRQFSNVAFSSSSKSPSPLQPFSQASHSSADATFQNPPSYGDVMSGDATTASSKKAVRQSSELSKYDKQRQHVDYNFQQGHSRSSQQPISYLQISSGSSQSTSNDPHNFMQEYSSNSGAQQRYKRKKNQAYSREQANPELQNSGLRNQILRYI